MPRQRNAILDACADCDAVLFLDDDFLAAPDYLAVTDHSATHGFGNHVTPDHLRAQIEAVREVNARTDGIEVLIGTETNIGIDGNPDYPDELLAELDWVMGSVHTAFGTEPTRRIVTACEHP